MTIFIMIILIPPHTSNILQDPTICIYISSFEIPWCCSDLWYPPIQYVYVLGHIQDFFRGSRKGEGMERHLEKLLTSLLLSSLRIFLWIALELSLWVSILTKIWWRHIENNLNFGALILAQMFLFPILIFSKIPGGVIYLICPPLQDHIFMFM